MNTSVFVRVLSSFCLLSVVSGANILAVVPTVSRSHYAMFDTLLRELADRGHNITSVTTFPQIAPIANLREIDVKPVRSVSLSSKVFEQLSDIPETFTRYVPKFFKYIEETEKVLNFTEVARLIDSRESFDLVITEDFIDDVYLGFSYRFSAPVIRLSSCYMFPWVPGRLGLSASPAHVPSFYSGFNTEMNLIQRFQNTFLDITGRFFYDFFLEPKSTEIVRSYFGESAPPVRDLVKNTSLYFINTHYSFFGARLYSPQVVDISGIHLKPPRPLHQELDEWMNSSTHGVVYFSFGSMLRGATLPEDKVRSFLAVFGSLRQRVLWKWEDVSDSIAGQGLPANVRLMKWIPQRDVLAHPRTRVFISHGGLLGTTEAVVSGVPVLGIPMYGDQPNNVAAMVRNGVAIHVDYNNISEASLSYALNALINDNSYTENARALRERFLDRPQSALETAVYWTEYVIRHKGAPHLRSAAVHMPWYQLWLLDVVAVCLLAVAVLYTFLRTCLRLVWPTRHVNLKMKTN